MYTYLWTARDRPNVGRRSVVDALASRPRALRPLCLARLCEGVEDEREGRGHLHTTQHGRGFAEPSTMTLYRNTMDTAPEDRVEKILGKNEHTWVLQYRRHKYKQRYRNVRCVALLINSSVRP